LVLAAAYQADTNKIKTTRFYIDLLYVFCHIVRYAKGLLVHGPGCRVKIQKQPFEIAGKTVAF